MSRLVTRVYVPLALAFAGAGIARAGDLGYRFKDGQCVDANGKAGFNPSFIGQCADLKGVTLGHLDLTGADLSGAQLQGSDLRLSVLAQATLTSARFDGANLSGVDLSNAVLTDAVLVNAVLHKAKAFKADFRGAKLAGTDATAMDAGYANFQGDDLTKARWAGAILTEANLTKTDLSGALLDGDELSHADFTGAKLADASLQKTVALNALFTNADLSRADLRSADLTDAVLDGVILTKAVFNKSTKFALTRDQAIAHGMIARDQREFVGPLLNVKLADLDGWKVCFTGLYGVEAQLDTVMQGCVGDKLMMACRKKGDTTLAVAAYADRTTVVKDTGAGTDTGVEGNGTKFYYHPGQSMGYAMAGSVLTKNSCDTGSDKAEQRLCWHLGATTINAGYRCGATTGLNSSQDWERLLLVPES